MSRTSHRSGRVAAWLALLALVAVGVALAVLLVRDLDALLLVLASLLVAGGAGWSPPSRLGAPLRCCCAGGRSRRAGRPRCLGRADRAHRGDRRVRGRNAVRPYPG